MKGLNSDLCTKVAVKSQSTKWVVQKTTEAYLNIYGYFENYISYPNSAPNIENARQVPFGKKRTADSSFQSQWTRQVGRNDYNFIQSRFSYSGMWVLGYSTTLTYAHPHFWPTELYKSPVKKVHQYSYDLEKMPGWLTNLDSYLCLVEIHNVSI